MFNCAIVIGNVAGRDQNLKIDERKIDSRLLKGKRTLITNFEIRDFLDFKRKRGFANINYFVYWLSIDK